MKLYLVTPWTFDEWGDREYLLGIRVDKSSPVGSKKTATWTISFGLVFFILNVEL